MSDTCVFVTVLREKERERSVTPLRVKHVKAESLSWEGAAKCPPPARMALASLTGLPCLV